ncbi:MAG: septum formation inhibitor Maf [Desulfobulbaceae bacterium]|uniref:dTTP/UTP pyrophosphatase n=1 Tax=Candidatus Desulfobia pelagia TaxID=2841692 RepID=A0A8J6TBB9_9BACT|nr:septum formation inhibitor Maf [Candidatus Desulfobia pelagia]
MQKEGKGGFATVGPLILASASPRRQKFLRELGIDFSVEVAEVDESSHGEVSPEAFVRRLAREKAEYVSRQFPQECVLAADTVVVLDSEILGKPDSPGDAETMLQRLSGRWHEVWTGFCVLRPADGLHVLEAVCTRVLFRELTEELCRAYVLTGEPLDKAGSYGLQGRGGFLVEEIDGSYSNVIGLPLAQVIDIMLKYGIIVPHLEEA